MSKRESIARCKLIINKLRKKPSSFNEIEDYLQLESEIHGYNYNISKRTFQRDVEDILSLFNIEIIYDFSQKVYYINNDDEPEINERILEAFDTFNALQLTDRLSDYLHFEKRKPQGTEHLNGILYAIKNKLQIKFTYQKYWEVEISQRIIEPYMLKEFKNRWYVLGNNLKDNTIKSFALDRISNLEITGKKFKYPDDFNVVNRFRYSFGIMAPNDEQPQEVILSFDPFQGKYIKSLPLHESQQILIDNEDELRVKLTLFVTHDFFMELLSYGENLKVIAPKSLIKDIKNSLQKTLKQY